MAAITLDDLRKRLAPGAAQVIAYDTKTLEDQGHKDTGRHINSLKYELTFTAQGIAINFTGLKYGLALNTGVPAINVRYSYHHVIAWARRKKPGLTNREINTFIYFMMKAHKDEGIPTEASKRFSKTGQRTGWVDLGTEWIEANFEDLFPIDDLVEMVLDDALLEILQPTL